MHCDSISTVGGVALYVSYSMEFCRLEYSIASLCFETLFMEVKLKNSAKDLVIGVIYRHPSTSLSEFKLQFTQTLSRLAKHKKDYIICGGFNVDLVKSQSSPSVNENIDSVFSEECFCMIDKPTQITPHSSTLLHHVYSNILYKTSTSNILQHEISDHLPTTHSVFLKPARIYNEQTYRCSAKFNCDNFTDDVCCPVDTLSIDSMTQNFDINLENMCTNFIDGFADIVNLHAHQKYLTEESRNKN